MGLRFWGKRGLFPGFGMEMMCADFQGRGKYIRDRAELKMEVIILMPL